MKKFFTLKFWFSLFKREKNYFTVIEPKMEHDYVKKKKSNFSKSDLDKLKTLSGKEKKKFVKELKEKYGRVGH